MQAIQKTILVHPDHRGAEILLQPLAVTPEANYDHLVEGHVVGLYPSFCFQTVEGFGCAMTESACYLLSRMPAAERRTWSRTTRG